MNRMIKGATVQRYYYGRHDQLEAHLANFINAYNYARRLKTLKGLTPDEYICKCWTSQPERFKLNRSSKCRDETPSAAHWAVRLRGSSRTRHVVGKYSKRASAFIGGALWPDQFAISAAKPRHLEHAKRLRSWSISRSQHWREWGRRTVLYLSNNLEAVTLVKGNVFRVRTFEVGSDALLITSLKSVFHQQCAKPLSGPVRIDGNERQIPMWLRRMMFGHSLPEVCHIFGDLRAQGQRHDCVQRIFILLHVGRQPQGRGATLSDDVCCAMLECSSATGVNELRHSPKILPWVRPTPTHQRIGGKAEHNCPDGACPNACVRRGDFHLRCHDVVLGGQSCKGDTGPIPRNGSGMKCSMEVSSGAFGFCSGSPPASEGRLRRSLRTNAPRWLTLGSGSSWRAPVLPGLGASSGSCPS
ncbi:hypothetical protein ACVI1I_006309 [Bradyrhizobium sp. USDA 4459]